MKKAILFPLLLLIASAAFSQNHYVIIGVFAKESNAIKYTGYAQSKYLEANYLLYQKRNLNYVFVFKTADKKEAFTRMNKIRKETEFNEAWVFSGFLGNDTQLSKEPIVIPEPAVVEPEPIVETQLDSVEVVVEEEIPVVIDSMSVAKTPTTPKGKYFIFSITDDEGHVVPGQLHYVDLAVGRDLATYKANEYTDVLRPNQTNLMTIVCGIFGYQQITKYIDYSNPASMEDVTQDENGAWIVPYKLVRLKKGDASVMYHVSFFKDAVVMTKESKTEMDELANMMNANPNYEIKIHGHCNGNHSRRIIALGNPKNYFDIKGSDERPGSAKELSSFRADAVKDYLMENGIDQKRIKTFAWGGMDMLVGENSNSARLNDRIEIEITQD